MCAAGLVAAMAGANSIASSRLSTLLVLMVRLLSIITFIFNCFYVNILTYFDLEKFIFSVTLLLCTPFLEVIHELDFSVPRLPGCQLGL
jgi:uncharacterized MAPEG superfamily protein